MSATVTETERERARRFVTSASYGPWGYVGPYTQTALALHRGTVGTKTGSCSADHRSSGKTHLVDDDGKTACGRPTDKMAKSQIRAGVFSLDDLRRNHSVCSTCAKAI